MRERDHRTLPPDLKTDAVNVLGDPIQLELAILNHTLNARDAMPEGGDLRVSSRASRVVNDSDLPQWGLQSSFW